MQRFVTVVAVLGLALSACGGDDDSATDTVADTIEESSSDAPTSTSASTSASTVADTTVPSTVSDTLDTASDDGTSSMDVASTDQDASAATTDAVSDDSGDTTINGTQIESLDDIPQECRDLFVGFLRDAEPVVADIDWATASIDDFQTISNELETLSSSMEQQGAESGCDELDFDTADEFGLLIELAAAEAPGAVGYLEFIREFTSGMATGTEETVEDSTAAGFETCADGIAFVQQLMDEYDAFAQAPASELAKMQALSGVMTTCTPDELAFFDSEEFVAFFGGTG